MMKIMMKKTKKLKIKATGQRGLAKKRGGKIKQAD